jgi:excisionase family DNA binding protein
MPKTELKRIAYRESEIPDLLGLGPSTVAKLVRSNELPHSRIGGSVFVSAETIESLLTPSEGGEPPRVS